MYVFHSVYYSVGCGSKALPQISDDLSALPLTRHSNPAFKHLVCELLFDYVGLGLEYLKGKIRVDNGKKWRFYL